MRTPVPGQLAMTALLLLVKSQDMVRCMQARLAKSSRRGPCEWSRRMAGNIGGG